MKAITFESARNLFSGMVARGEAECVYTIDRRVTNVTGTLVLTRVVNGPRIVFYSNKNWVGEFAKDSDFAPWAALLENTEAKVEELQQLFVISTVFGQGSGLWANGSLSLNKHAHGVGDWL